MASLPLPSCARFVRAVSVAASFAALVLFVAAVASAQPVPGPASGKGPIPVTPAVPILTADQNIQVELSHLNLFLDTNPRIEEALRTNVDKATDAAFLKLNPAWDQHLQQRPNTLQALRAERGFLLHRALARMAHTPLLRDEVAQFDAFLEKNPSILRALEGNPHLIREGAFLTANPALAAFLDAHAALSTALFGDRQMSPGKKGGARPAKKS